MTDTSASAAAPITDKRQLVEYLESGCKPRDKWRIGTEHEKFAYCLQTLKPLPYEGDRGIEALLKGLERFDWEPVREKGKVIALNKPDFSSITLEPAGQVELSGAPLETIHQTCKEVA
ncbi:MAG: glutamate--cysteine ligase, partial [Rhodobacterales bacterium]|nr:glutamate--cysteine ligase [Rhodobacterales bacterium]